MPRGFSSEVSRKLIACLISWRGVTRFRRDESMEHDSRSKSAAVVLAGLAIFGVAIFHASLDESSLGHVQAGNGELNQQVVDIEVNQLAVSPGRATWSSRTKIPQAVRMLENRRVRIRGYMLPLDKNDPTKLIVNCEIEDEIAAAYFRTNRAEVFMPFYIPVNVRNEFNAESGREPFVVEGTLRIDARAKGDQSKLFRIDDATFKPTKARKGFQRAIDWRC